MFATAIIIISTRVATGIWPASLVLPTGTKFGFMTQKAPNKIGEARKYVAEIWPDISQKSRKRHNFYFLLFLHEAIEELEL
jgi:hypothetical protein